ncbi:MAG TPA: NAD(P)H nitroreductase [Mycobacterium sp.]|nr:NAD(P)H nitroreductase [Mycobacterium sp.]
MPTTIVGTETIRSAVQSACRAPSLHNSQPWRWVLDRDGRLQLFLDSGRVLHYDRSRRQAVIGCGAALDHLRVAAAAAGWRALIDRFPNPSQPDHLASIHFTPMDYVTDGHRRRASAIWERRTDRLPFAAPADWGNFEALLRNAIDDDVVRLDVLPRYARPRLVQASQLAESLRLYDSLYHAELARWTAPFTLHEGIPQSSLVTAAESDRVDVGRVFPIIHQDERRVAIPEDDSMILVLSTDTDNRSDALAAGEALSAVLLECTMAGLATCPLTHLTEVRVTRELVSAVVGGGVLPQILVRVGVAPTLEDVPPPTPRRRLGEVLSIPGE